MPAVMGRCALLLGLAVVFTLSASGCTVGTKSFSMDSNSRIPFFGLELKERKAKSSAPSFNSISHSKPDRLRIASAVQSGPQSLSVQPTMRDSRQATITVSKSDEVARTTTAAPAAMEQTESIPLPVSDDARRGHERVAAAAVIDFQ